MGLADIMLGGGGVLFGRRPGKIAVNAATPGTFPANHGTAAGGAGTPIPQSGNLAIDPNSGLTPNMANYRDLVANPPQEGMDPNKIDPKTGLPGKPISKFRKIMGEIASVAGPMIGGPGVTGLGEKLLHPGMEAWQQKVARANALSNLDMTALQHRDLQQNRADMNTARVAAQTDREQGNIDRVENKGAWQVPLGSLSQKLMYQENAPQTGDPIADLPTQQMNLKGGIATGADVIDPRTGKRAGDVGDVEMMDKPGTQGKDKVAMLRPSQATLGDFAADAESKKRKAALEEARTEEITPEMIDAAKTGGMTVLPSPGLVTPTVYNNFMTQSGEFGRQKNKPTDKPVDQQVFESAIRGVAAKHGITLDDSKPLMAQLPVAMQGEAAQEHKRLNALPPSDLDKALKEALLTSRNNANSQFAEPDPAQVDYWKKQVQGDSAKFSMIQNDKGLSKAVRSALAADGVDVNKLDAQTRDAAAFSKTALVHAKTIDKSIDALEKNGQLGIATSRWNAFLNGKVGTGDPEFNALRDNVKLLSSAMARIHGGARGGSSPAMIEYMKNIMNAETMDPTILRSSLGVIKDWLGGYAGMAGNSEPSASGNAAAQGKITVIAGDGSVHPFDTEQQAKTFETTVKSAGGTTKRQ